MNKENITLNDLEAHTMVMKAHIRTISEYLVNIPLIEVLELKDKLHLRSMVYADIKRVQNETRTK